MRFLLLLFLGTCLGCSSSATNDEEQTNTNEAEVTAAPERDWYKQYAGTVAGQPVVAQLHKYGDEFHGSYYYTARG